MRHGGVPCQLEALPARLEAGPPSWEEPWSWYLRGRSHRLLAKVRRALAGAFRRGGSPAPAQARAAAEALPAPALRAGDRVRVRSADFVRSTLDENGAYRGCGFGLGQYAYCGRELRVARVVERFYDEARGRMLRARNMVLLEGVHCDGSSCLETQGCQRMCFYFWRTEWLEKVG
jgi:hypothetical protein